MSFLSSLFSGGKVGEPTAPTFQADPLVGQTDTELNNFGTNVLQGILPSSYQDLIETNSPAFQKFENNSNAQIQGSGLSTAAMQGNARSGAANAGITSAIASNSANLGYQDLLNTQLNQKAILGSGLSAIGTANTGALTNQGQQNSFATNVYGTQMQGYGVATNYNEQMAQLSAQLAGQLSKGIGSDISSLPFMGMGSSGGSNPGGLLGKLGAFGDITGAGTGAAGAAGALGALGTSAGAAAFAGTGGMDALLAEGSPLLLAAA